MPRLRVLLRASMNLVPAWGDEGVKTISGYFKTIVIASSEYCERRCLSNLLRAWNKVKNHAQTFAFRAGTLNHLATETLRGVRSFLSSNGTHFLHIFRISRVESIM